LYERSITVVKDDQHILPLTNLENNTFASLSIGRAISTSANFLSKYAPFDSYAILSAQDTANLFKTLSNYTVVTVSVYPEAAALEQLYPEILQRIKSITKTIVVVFASPAKLSLVDNMPTIIQAYTDEAIIQKKVPQVIFGAKQANGHLPVSVNDNIKHRAGIATPFINRLSYATPETVGVHRNTLHQITQIAQEAIEQEGAPGCQIIVARKGRIIYENSFGWQTYDKAVSINDESIYDIAKER
jgi:hypothetical protein